MAGSLGVPLFINARMDTFLSDVAGSHDGNTDETIERAKAYLQAGADGIYPIGVGDVATLRVIYDAVQAPINVYGSASTAPMRDLEAAGVRRLSIGPWLLKASLTAMRDVAETLKNYGSYDIFTEGVMSSDDVRQYLSGEPRS